MCNSLWLIDYFISIYISYSNLFLKRNFKCYVVYIIYKYIVHGLGIKIINYLWVILSGKTYEN